MAFVGGGFADGLAAATELGGALGSAGGALGGGAASQVAVGRSGAVGRWGEQARVGDFERVRDLERDLERLRGSWKETDGAAVGACWTA